MYACMYGWVGGNECIYAWVDAWKGGGGYMYICMGGWIMNTSVNIQMCGWMDRWVDVRVGEWMGRVAGRWVDGQTDW